MFYKYHHSPTPETYLFKGTKAQLKKKLKATGMTVASGCDNRYILVGFSSGKIYEYADETETTHPIRVVTPDTDMLRSRYNKTRITEEDYIRLAEELNEGVITFDSLLQKNGE